MNNDLISREALKKAITEATYNFEQIPIRVDKVQEIIDNAPTVEPFAEVTIHLRDRIKDINHEITIPQSDEAKCILDGKRKGFQYVLDLLEVKNETN